MSVEFILPIRVYYEDTDAGGVVYYANYLKFYERARSEWLIQLNIDQPKLLQENRVFVVTRAEVDYIKPAKLNNQLIVKTSIGRVTAARVVFKQQLWLQDDNLANEQAVLLNQAVISVACLKLNTFSPCRMPAFVKEEFQRVS
jgi:acyl-CoA thioester hydrolase